ncbi:hypothetical protein CDL12_18783 [Handroanthus impetiginosus]|uniref:Uncharacterized protein n=1 Tax=Handroanthus impetiginosus TaxID=429701 RepID=A0A2G9GUF4_9LAMI|nr:hypothetical protein CDL12_18783 [Handroanthus impetiginosus]
MDYSDERESFYFIHFFFRFLPIFVIFNFCCGFALIRSYQKIKFKFRVIK